MYLFLWPEITSCLFEGDMKMWWLERFRASEMATGGASEQLTHRQIVRLATAISDHNMAAIAEGYMDISDETIKNVKYENKGNPEAFNREIIR